MVQHPLALLRNMEGTAPRFASAEFTLSHSQDFSSIIFEYCKNGPEIEYIRRGNWAVFRDADNGVVDQERFSSILEPEMRFDIGVILQVLSATSRTCPQCGHHNSGTTPVDGWITWQVPDTRLIMHICMLIWTSSYLECGNLFRIVFYPSPKEPNGKYTEPMASKRVPYKVLSFIKNFARIPSKKSIPRSSGTSQASDEKKPQLTHLATKFHRILANAPHPHPPQERVHHQEKSKVRKFINSPREAGRR